MAKRRKYYENSGERHFRYSIMTDLFIPPSIKKEEEFDNGLRIN
jgi:hypothetical protein